MKRFKRALWRGGRLVKALDASHCKNPLESVRAMMAQTLCEETIAYVFVTGHNDNAPLNYDLKNKHLEHSL